MLRSVGASSALAVALLGLSAAPAGAELPPFGPSSSTPSGAGDIGHNSTAALGDLDGDGDLDLVAGETYGGFFYFANTASATFAAFTAAANPLAGQDVGSFSAPALGDLDGDGDLDLLAGRSDGTFVYYVNSGSATSPSFAVGVSPLSGVDVGWYSTPALGDLDRDGDLDLVAGGLGGFFYFENTGSATTPGFAARTGSANPFGAGVGYIPGGIPALGDLDRDGDLDFVAGENFGTLFTFENTGSVKTPAFVARTGSANPLNGFDVGGTSAPALGDLDGDGDPDLVSGEFDGVFNTIGNAGGLLVLRTGAANPLAGQDIGLTANPALADLDHDGDLDLVAGSSGSISLFYFENTGSASSAAFIQRTGLANPFNSFSFAADASPAAGDVDRDGDVDFVLGSTSGVLEYLQNTGSAATPKFTFANQPGFHDVGSNSKPSLGDLDGDGDLDLAVGDSNSGSFFYFENTGVGSGVFAERTGSANPLNGIVFPGQGVSPALGDLDGDGDTDLLARSADAGLIAVIENTGTAASAAFVLLSGADDPIASQSGLVWTPVFGDLDGDGDLDLVTGQSDGGFAWLESFVVQPPIDALSLTGAANPLAGQDIGSLSGPALADLDRDGDVDLIAGEGTGTFRYFENTGSATGVRFVARTGAANPLDGRDVGDLSKPALADLDGDGDLDLLAGRLAGDFDYFANTGNPLTPAFAAPVANPFGLIQGSDGASAPAFADVDHDGDLDLVVGGYYSAPRYFENTGSRTGPGFIERIGGSNPFTDLDMAYDPNPALGDFDGDGDVDLVTGSTLGRLRYFHNSGSAIAPRYARLIGAGNPLNGEDVGDRSSPAAADLDGDGDLDLVTGSLAGTFAVHYFPEPARGLLLGAGIALLSRLERIRRRRS